MKTTAKTLVGWIALAIILSARMAAAGSLYGMSQTWLGVALVGQASPVENAVEDKAAKSADLLNRARLAMAEKDFSAADSLISQAEALDVKYGPTHVGDTPKKARRDLQWKRNLANAAPTKPSKLFAPLGLNKNKNISTTDPFAGRAVESNAVASDARQLTPLPRVGDTDSVRSLSMQGRQPMQPPTEPSYRMAQPGQNDVRAPGAMGRGVAGNSPLRAARLALAVGDVRRASELTQQARNMQVSYQPLDDTPDKVEAAIRKYQDLSSIDQNSDAYRRAYATNLMDQADALLNCGEQGEAERLAQQAARIRIIYGPFERKPEDILRRITDVRRQGNGRQLAAPAGLVQPGASAGPASGLVARQQAVELVNQARDAMSTGQLDRAESLARQAEQLQVPDAAFGPNEDRPGLVLLDLRMLRGREASKVVPAGGEYGATTGANGGPNFAAARAVYNPSNDFTRNLAASAQEPAYASEMRLTQRQPTSVKPPQAPPPDRSVAAPSGVKTAAMMLFEQGEAALKAGDTARAYDLFRQATTRMGELDAVTAQRLQDHMQAMAAPSYGKPPAQAGQAPTMAEAATARQQLLARAASADLAHVETNAAAMLNRDPKGALTSLEEARKKIETSGLDAASRDQLLRRVDRAIGNTRRFMDENRPQIELSEKNKSTQQEVDRQRQVKVQVGEKLALKIDEFNRLMDEQRFEEAGVVAREASQLDPENPVAAQTLTQWKLVSRIMTAKALQEKKEEAFMDTLKSVDDASVAFNDKNPMVFPNERTWGKISKRTAKYESRRQRKRTEKEIDIEKKLRTPVSLQFQNTSLSKVLKTLSTMTGVDMYPDPQGLEDEGVTYDTQVNIELHSEIMLKSALHLILEPLHLGYVIEDDVLKITSEQKRNGRVFMKTYNVADLVIPIPNFVPNPNMGLSAAYMGAMSAAGTAGVVPFAAAGSSVNTPISVASNRSDRNGGGSLNPSVYAQQMPGGMPTMPGASGKSPSIGPGPGGAGGGPQADFDPLIELITSTVGHNWQEDGAGEGTIAPFESNLSIVISQTQEVHEQIEDLLQQLRRLQDLQVTIEVRFITLNDNFFERIGVSFDFDIESNTIGKGLAVEGFGGQAGGTQPNSSRTATVGLQAPGVFSADLDIPMTQNSYALAIPQFGGFDATAGAQMGFAILSNIEAYFFISAAQGDKRSNVLQAPKVTLFNGQQAMVSDTSQSPFVISVIPVVGDFAVAQQPVIVVLSEGTSMTVQAVVTDDKRFVRLTVVPFFSDIGEVSTFTFTGTQTTTSNTTRSGIQSAATDVSKLWNSTSDEGSTATTGTTVQLPTFSYVTVTTTVSVPDGGTVLLGGIKRLSEGRNEFGVPILNKLPYINRLFQNVAIGRETQSLMMMVTPRIIIQEEEEENLGIQPEER